MKRINIRYDGAMYSVGGRELGELQEELAGAVSSEKPYWLEVNEGEGVPRPALLLITPAVAVALLPVPEPDPEPEPDSDPSGEESPEPAR
jgi:hypothetical protein